MDEEEDADDVGEFFNIIIPAPLDEGTVPIIFLVSDSSFPPAVSDASFPVHFRGVPLCRVCERVGGGGAGGKKVGTSGERPGEERPRARTV